METLPLELLEPLLLCLDPIDRVDKALICHRWAECMVGSLLLDNVPLRLCGSTLLADFPSLMESRRQYSHLHLTRVSLYALPPEFWMKFAGNLLSLRLIDCCFSNQALSFVLGQCTRLEFLEITRPRLSSKLGHKPYGRGPPPISSAFRFKEAADSDIGSEEVRRVLLNLRDLSLHIDFEDCLGLAMASRLLELTPNLDFLHLPCRAFRVVPYIIANQKRLTKLNLRAFSSEEPGLEELLKRMSGTLKELCLTNCGSVVPRTFNSVNQCVHLQKLTLIQPTELSDSQIGDLLAKSPQLTFVQLVLEVDLSDEILTPISNLKHLRHLELVNSKSLENCIYLQSLESTRIRCAPRVLETITELQDLRTLMLVNFDITSAFLDKIIENLPLLEHLQINCQRLADEEGVKIRQLQHLRSLSLLGALFFHDETFSKGLGSPVMEKLELEGSRLTDRGFRSIVAHHGHLRKLKLVNCPNISLSGLLTALSRETNLHELVLSARFADHNEKPWFLRSLTDTCPRLRVLHLLPLPYREEAEFQMLYRRTSAACFTHYSEPNMSELDRSYFNDLSFCP
ncbi:uncharacterized protein LOC100902531 [Galendromus occidentalis]|uniref:Uncharacterized protein LOC100902531 n=1 Tax=Galendromus occidentalis TaxID=34638 RepID=A0AAJ6VVY3_9ACAR|nr:uncharacterized protein LOC100902531 [Galendromus occidentalis]